MSAPLRRGKSDASFETRTDGIHGGEGSVEWRCHCGVRVIQPPEITPGGNPIADLDGLRVAVERHYAGAHPDDPRPWEEPGE